MTPEVHVAALAASGAAMAEAADGMLDRPVPSCPGWDVAELVWHTGIVHKIWRELVAGDIAGPDEFTAGPRPGPNELVDWFRHGLDATVTVVGHADPAAAGAGGQRRMGHRAPSRQGRVCRSGPGRRPPPVAVGPPTGVRPSDLR